MCGIAGLLRYDGIGEEESRSVERMTARLVHRGPDGGATWSDRDVALGHRRLAIIDLSAGDQPLWNETGDVGVLFNGEIYNFGQLRAELEQRGHVFRTRTDTEVIVHGYEEWGDDAVARLRGMFAFAIWDARSRRLLLARDRLGIKPLYHATDAANRFAFASEIKALFGMAEIAPRANRDCLPEYLLYRSIAGEATLFEGVRELPPGETLVITRTGVKRRRYWSPDPASGFGALSPTPGTEPRDPGTNGSGGTGISRELIEHGRDLLREAVRLRLVSDVPLGTITSGGLDSSLVSVIAAQLTGSPIDTFVVGFDDPSYDERGYASEVAVRIASRHHEVVVGAADIAADLDALTWAHDEPLTHPNSIPMHRVFRHAKERVGVTVLLSGEGADEVFGGYEWYRIAHLRSRLRRVPGLAALSHVLPFARAATLRRVLHPDYLLEANTVATPRGLAALDARVRAAVSARAPFWTGARDIDGLFQYDQRTYLPPLLQRQDRMSMAAGLEARVPFLDHRLVEWANALPAGVKVPGGKRKALLKQLAAPWLPTEIADRRKVGFAMPIDRWLREEPGLTERVAALDATHGFCREVFDAQTVSRLVREHSAGVTGHGDLLWTLIALESWASQFLRSDLRDVRLPGAATGRVLPGASASPLSARG